MKRDGVAPMGQAKILRVSAPHFRNIKDVDPQFEFIPLQAVGMNSNVMVKNQELWH
jgi:hypothetical protein